jgi:hypothetical protein
MMEGGNMLLNVYVRFPEEGQIDGHPYSDRARGLLLALRYGIHVLALEDHPLRKRIRYCERSEFPTSLNLWVEVLEPAERQEVIQEMDALFADVEVGVFPGPPPKPEYRTNQPLYRHEA